MAKRDFVLFASPVKPNPGMDSKPQIPPNSLDFEHVQAPAKRARADIFDGLPDEVRISSKVEKLADSGRLSVVGGKDAWYWQMMRQYQPPRPPSASSSKLADMPEPVFICVSCATQLKVFYFFRCCFISSR